VPATAARARCTAPLQAVARPRFTRLAFAGALKPLHQRRPRGSRTGGDGWPSRRSARGRRARVMRLDSESDERDVRPAAARPTADELAEVMAMIERMRRLGLLRRRAAAVNARAGRRSCPQQRRRKNTSLRGATRASKARALALAATTCRHRYLASTIAPTATPIPHFASGCMAAGLGHQKIRFGI
jgi:hypothetical protein